MVRPKEKGQAMAEFALIMPVLILLLFGMTFAALLHLVFYRQFLPPPRSPCPILALWGIQRGC